MVVSPVPVVTGTNNDGLYLDDGDAMASKRDMSVEDGSHEPRNVHSILTTSKT